MIKVIGTEPKLLKKATCTHCTSILEYAPNDVVSLGYKDEGCEAVGFKCPVCGTTVRTNH